MATPHSTPCSSLNIMDSTVAVSGQLTIQSAASLIDAMLFAEERTPSALSLALDLDGVTFVTPSAIVALAAMIEHARPRLSALRVVLPRNSDCRRYLAAAGFAQAIAQWADVPESDDVRGLEPSAGLETLLPLCRLSGTDQIPGLLQGLERSLDSMLGGGDTSWDSTKRPILSTIRELCDNVFQHAGGAPGWVAAQKYRNRKSGKDYVEIAIGDAGRGIRRTLATRFTELLKVSDGEALERMLVEHLTRSTNAYRGVGFFVLQKATKDLDGSFYLRSGAGALERARRGALVRKEGLSAWPGAQLEMRLTCP